jgi:hypothetical protein
MLVFRRICALLIVLAATALSGTTLATMALRQGEFPDRDTFIRKVREAMRRDYVLQSQFSYIEERRDIKISKLGKVEVGPLRTFEVFPSAGGTYKRLIAVEGKPLSAEELARRDREHQEHLAEMVEREKNESLADRAKRLSKMQEEAAERDAILEDAFAVFDATFESREVIDGELVFAIALRPRDDARPRTRPGRWMKKFAGRVWIAETSHQIVKVDLRAMDDVTIGLGIVGRVHEGSRLVYARRRFENAWLPSELIFDATGRTLLFRPFHIDVVTTYSAYKRIQ